MKSSRRRSGRGTRRLLVETLESRRVLDAQGALLAGPQAADIGAGPEAIAPAGESDAATPAFSRFASAEEVQQYVIQDALHRYADLFGKEAWSWPYPFMEVRDSAIRVTGLAATAPGSVSAVDHSDTNNQVAGVEEADLVQTDGDYLYVLTGQQISIVDLQAPSGMSVVSTTATVGQPVAMYLDGDRLTVISNDYSWVAMLGVASGAPSLAADAMWAPQQSEPTFSITVLDVTDHAHPQVARQLKLEGSYVDSRAIDGFVYVVSQSSFVLPPPKAHAVPENDDSSAPPADARLLPYVMPVWIDPFGTRMVYETQEEYLARLQGQVLELALPNFFAYDAQQQLQDSGFLTAPEDIYQPLVPQASNLMSITSIRVTAETPAIASSVSAPLGWATEVYVSPTSLYLAVPSWSESWLGGESTAIYQFGLDPASGQVALAAAGAVPGHLLNQFALDEYGGYLRVVTQQGWRNTAQTGLYVLQPQGQSLELVGSLEQLAPGEHVFSVRFLGDLGYVVTFGPTGGLWYDPLFTLDLRKPAQPEVVGRLDIPGFSNYLQAIEGHYLLGLGRNADTSNGRELEPQVSLYDVADPAAPQLAARLSFADQGSAWSEAFNDHHAVAYYPEYHILAIPMTTYGPVPGQEGRALWDLYRTQSALWVFRIDVQAEATDPGRIQLLGQIAHDTTVRRSVRVGSALYSVSQDTVKASPIEDPDFLLGEVKLPPPAAVDRDPVDPPPDPVGESGPQWSASVPEADLSADGRKMVALAVAELAQRLAVPVAAITVARVDSVEWSDSSLGLPEDGQFYAQVITDGFQIDLDRAGTRYTYHTDTRNSVRFAGAAPAEAAVRVRLQAVDDSGQPIDQVEAGQPFTLNIYVQDVRSSAQQSLDSLGVQAAYVDVFFPDGLVDVRGGITWGSDFAANTSGSVTAPGLLDEVGGARTGSLPGGAEQLLASIPLQARWPGWADFVGSTADLAGHEILVPGGDAVAAEHLGFESARLEITAGWQNADNPADVNRDGAGTPLDVLTLINRLNAKGPEQLGTVREFLQQAPDARRAFVDVNGDGLLSPQDVLVIINRLNQLSAQGREWGSDTSRGWGWVRDLARPLAGLVDWGTLAQKFDDPALAGTLSELNLTAAQALDWVHQGLAGVTAQPLATPGADPADPVDPRAVVEQLAQLLLKQGDTPVPDRLQTLVDRADELADDLDWAALLPGLAPHLDLTAAREAIRDRLFARLSDPASGLLSLMTG